MALQQQEVVMTEIRTSLSKVHTFATRLRTDRSGLALVEFAVSLPFFMGLAIGGIETAIYAATTMQVNQIVVHVADNAARMGIDNLVGKRRVEEGNINDVFTGARHEGRGLTLDGFHPYTDPGTGQVVQRGNARIMLSSVEPVASPNTTNRYRIRWQRCTGPGTHYQPVYGKVSNSSNVIGIGPTGRQSTAPDFGGVMFVEMHYHFEPMLDIGFTRLVETDIVASAAMIVRDSRDFAGPSGGQGIWPTTGQTASTCNF